MLTMEQKGKNIHFLSGTNITRPQLEFADTIDNSNVPFVQKIRFKHNAKRPLDYGKPDDISDSFAVHVKSLGITGLAHHPYEYEIDNLEYPTHVLSKREAIMYKSFADTPFTYVVTESQLKAMVEILNQSQEIAVDLEV